MLKLIIADDEKIIRETIRSIIDWKSLDIEVVGLCQNGIEAYNMMMDETPDIVLTDIKMPGMSGLELIEKASVSYPDMQFIILSGFGEFEYAKAAMKYGVKHYLLKPCNESQIIECIEECKKECYQRRLTQAAAGDSFEAANRINHNVMFNIINDCICQGQPLTSLMARYESYMDFTFTPYRICYVYFLPPESLDLFLSDLKAVFVKAYPNITLHGVYVSNTLVLFFKNYRSDYSGLDSFLINWHKDTLKTSLEIHQDTHSSLEELLKTLISRISRYGLIYYINSFRAVYTCNYKSHVDDLDSICLKLKAGSEDALTEFERNIDGIHTCNFMKQIASTVLLKLSLGNPDISSILLTEWLTEIEKKDSLSEIKETVILRIREILRKNAQQHPESQMIAQIYNYVRENLSDSNLTLKYISENCLYMNVDYVSKKFLKETGERFSAYLTNTRIEKAKEYLLSGKYEKIQDIAENVGLGNNPQYFSQLFKKETGMTPSSFVAEHKTE